MDVLATHEWGSLWKNSPCRGAAVRCTSLFPLIKLQNIPCFFFPHPSQRLDNQALCLSTTPPLPPMLLTAFHPLRWFWAARFIIFFFFFNLSLLLLSEVSCQLSYEWRWIFCFTATSSTPYALFSAEGWPKNKVGYFQKLSWELINSYCLAAELGALLASPLRYLLCCCSHRASHRKRGDLPHILAVISYLMGIN